MLTNIRSPTHYGQLTKPQVGAAPFKDQSIFCNQRLLIFNAAHYREVQISFVRRRFKTPLLTTLPLNYKIRGEKKGYITIKS